MTVFVDVRTYVRPCVSICADATVWDELGGRGPCIQRVLLRHRFVVRQAEGAGRGEGRGSAGGKEGEGGR